MEKNVHHLIVDLIQKDQNGYLFQAVIYLLFRTLLAIGIFTLVNWDFLYEPENVRLRTQNLKSRADNFYSGASNKLSILVCVAQGRFTSYLISGNLFCVDTSWDLS